MATQRLRANDNLTIEDSAPLEQGMNDFMETPDSRFLKDPENDDSFKVDRRSMAERISKDKSSIMVLLLLYILQGIPIGLAGSIPIILQSKKIGYRQQALFSLVIWPFTIKLLWAPIVDSIYSSRFGRRKSWLIPCQYAIGLTMIILSYFVKSLMGDEDSGPNVVMLTIVFFFLHFLAATQDIAVDGWALTMLSKENVGLASTCNSVGQTAGFFLSYTFFLAFHSPEFCNRYIRSVPQDTGIVDMPAFMFFFGMLFVVVTSGVWWFKKETKEEHRESDRNILSGYMNLLGVLKLPAVQTYALAILTSKIAFAAADSVSGLKLVEAGLPQEQIALMAIPMVPVQIVLPWVISQFTAGPKPMSVFLQAYTPRIFMGLLFAAIVAWTSCIHSNGEFPFYYYLIIIAIFLVHQVFTYSMFVSIMAFHAKISDPVIGGTYMTLLNTISNMAAAWTGTLALWLVDNVSFKDCVGVTDLSLDCDTMQQLKACEEAGGKCVTHMDGYYVEMGICVVFGLLWLLWQRKKIDRLQSLPASHWKTMQ